MRAAAAVPDRGMKAEEVSRDSEDPARTCISSLSAPPAAPVGEPSLGIGGREVTLRLVQNISIAISGDILASSSSARKPLSPRKD